MGKKPKYENIKFPSGMAHIVTSKNEDGQMRTRVEFHIKDKPTFVSFEGGRSGAYHHARMMIRRVEAGKDLIIEGDKTRLGCSKGSLGVKAFGKFKDEFDLSVWSERMKKRNPKWQPSEAEILREKDLLEMLDLPNFGMF